MDAAPSVSVLLHLDCRQPRSAGMPTLSCRRRSLPSSLGSSNVRARCIRASIACRTASASTGWRSSRNTNNCSCSAGACSSVLLQDASCLSHFVRGRCAEVGSNNIDVYVLGNLPEDEAREFFLSVALKPELHSAVTDDVWAEIYQVRPHLRYKGVLSLHTCML